MHYFWRKLYRTCFLRSESYFSQKENKKKKKKNYTKKKKSMNNQKIIHENVFGELILSYATMPCQW